MDADLVLAIHKVKENFKSIKFEHVYSHQDTTNGRKKAQKAEKSKQSKQKEREKQKYEGRENDVIRELFDPSEETDEESVGEEDKIKSRHINEVCDKLASGLSKQILSG